VTVAARPPYRGASPATKAEHKRKKGREKERERGREGEREGEGERERERERERKEREGERERKEGEGKRKREKCRVCALSRGQVAVGPCPACKPPGKKDAALAFSPLRCACTR